ncbi:aminoglycoside N(3)-acetyltransferase [Salinirubrum litoreum]|uniref:Aminoglycoside N(3)-acetyltransferase n=1 Tax=Salinirubrum litoreum TaxID=1126234 RepID=A0ABD5R9F6_9EURY|nr:AAC(3) family N-acetyltransferase [Salinirubrum litoreum]
MTDRPRPEEQSPDPITTDRLVTDLRDLGVESGDTLLVHSSLSSLGWVSGGPVAVVDALLDAVGESGTVVCPTHSTDFSDPADWQNPSVPDDWEGAIRETMPAYRPEITPTRGMGAIPETFRDYPEATRSRHPAHSFAALGPDAEFVVSEHSYDDSLGEGSPLARCYDLDARVLLLGVGHERNTSLHLAEYRADIDVAETTQGGPILRDGERVWAEFSDIAIDDEDFGSVGDDFEAARPDAVRRGEVGVGDAALVEQTELVDYAVEWFETNRD